jgi:hypothetical protein
VHVAERARRVGSTCNDLARDVAAEHSQENSCVYPLLIWPLPWHALLAPVAVYKSASCAGHVCSWIHAWCSASRNPPGIYLVRSGLCVQRGAESARQLGTPSRATGTATSALGRLLVVLLVSPPVPNRTHRSNWQVCAAQDTSKALQHRSQTALQHRSQTCVVLVSAQQVQQQLLAELLQCLPQECRNPLLQCRMSQRRRGLQMRARCGRC